MAAQKMDFTDLSIGIAVGLFVFAVLIGAFAGTILDNLNTIATHPNMTTEGAATIANANTMFALIPLGLFVAAVVVVFLVLKRQ